MLTLAAAPSVPASETAAAVARQFLLLCALLAPLEILVPARRRPLARPGWLTDSLYFALAPFVVNAGAALLFAALTVAVGAVVPEAWRAGLRAQPWAIQFGEVFLLSELGAYWIHRLSHRSQFLWRFHAVHHSNQEMDWLAAHRQHPLEAIWLLGVANLPALLLGFSTEPLLGFVLAQKLYTAFLHANVRIGYRRLDALIASPRFHHWHHHRYDAAVPGARSVNFASTLSLLDRLFGTWSVPDDFPPRYGTDEPVPTHLPGQLAYPFLRPALHPIRTTVAAVLFVSWAAITITTSAAFAVERTPPPSQLDGGPPRDTPPPEKQRPQKRQHARSPRPQLAPIEEIVPLPSPEPGEGPAESPPAGSAQSSADKSDFAPRQCPDIK